MLSHKSVDFSVLGGKTSLEVWSGKPIYGYDSIHVFGCLAYCHVIHIGNNTSQIQSTLVATVVIIFS